MSKADKKNKAADLSWIQRLILRKAARKADKVITHKVDNMNKSSQTTIYGLVAAIGLLANQLLPLFDGDPNTNISIAAICTTLTGIFGIFKLGQKARDNNITSEQAGAK